MIIETELKLSKEDYEKFDYAMRHPDREAMKRRDEFIKDVHLIGNADDEICVHINNLN